MMKIIADLHTHTISSGHAYGTIRENAFAAGEAGLRILGTSEHGPGIPGTCDPIYFVNLRCVPDELYGVRILRGSEINVLAGGKLSLEDRYIDYLDYAIAGIHPHCYQVTDAVTNTRDVIGCMQAHRKVRFISHPDDDRIPMDYEMLVKGARDYGVALEVNNRSLVEPVFRINSRGNYRTMLELCEKYRVPVIVDSDAHDPSAVGKVNLAIEMIENYGFDQSLILNLDEQKLLEFLLRK